MPETPAGGIVVASDGPEVTAALAEVLAGMVQGGDLLVLSGDLGAGKTTFTKAFAAALGVTAPVTSPTFTLANRYQGDLVVNHLDAYRITDPNEIVDLGLDDLLVDDAVTVIEWGDTIVQALPTDRLDVAFNHVDADAGVGDQADPVAIDAADRRRRIDLVAMGPSWRDRLALVDIASAMDRVRSC